MQQQCQAFALQWRRNLTSPLETQDSEAMKPWLLDSDTVQVPAPALCLSKRKLTAFEVCTMPNSLVEYGFSWVQAVQCESSPQFGRTWKSWAPLTRWSHKARKR